MPAMIHNVAARVSTPSARPLSDSVKRQTRLARFAPPRTRKASRGFPRRSPRAGMVPPPRARTASRSRRPSARSSARSRSPATRSSGSSSWRSEGGVDIPPPVNAAASMCGPMVVPTVTGANTTERDIPGKPAGLTKPPWLRQRAPGGDRYEYLTSGLKDLKLATVCEEAMCPNLGECWNGDTGNRDDHDPRRHVHARMPLLRGEHRVHAPAPRRDGAREHRQGHRGVGRRLRRVDVGGPRRHPRRRSPSTSRGPSGPSRRSSPRSSPSASRRTFRATRAR